MSTKTQTSSTQAIQYDPSSMSAFNAFQPRVQENWMQDSQLDPTKSSTYNLGLSGMQRAAQQLSARNRENFFGNLKAGGYAGNNLSGVQQMGLTGLGMGASALSSNAFNQNFLNYDAMRRNTVNAMASYRPLQTGQTQNSTQTTSGLGTWLPQVIGAGLQVAGAVATGGASLAATAATKAASAGGGFMNSALKSGGYFNSDNNFSANNGNFFGSSNGNMFNANAYSGLNGWRNG